MKAAPIVNLNTAALIKELVGEYNNENETVIHAIAINERALLRDCRTMADYKVNVERFVKRQREWEASKQG